MATAQSQPLSVTQAEKEKKNQFNELVSNLVVHNQVSCSIFLSPTQEIKTVGAQLSGMSRIPVIRAYVMNLFDGVITLD